MSAKLIIDLAKSRLQEESQVQCSYKHHPANKGFDSLLEMIRFALICRRCESAHLSRSRWMWKRMPLPTLTLKSLEAL